MRPFEGARLPVMSTQTFHVKKVYRAGLAVGAGIGALALGGLVAGVDGGPRPVSMTCFILAGLASWAVGIGMSIEREMTLDLADGTLTASWRRGSLRPGTVRIGRWVQPQIHTPVGIVAYVQGPGGSVRIGARDPIAGTYPIDGPRARWVDCHMAGADLGVLLAELGVQPGPATAVEALELVRRRVGFRMMVPWLLTMICATLAGLGLVALGAPQSIMAAVTLAILLAGMVVTVLDSWRIREPTRQLRLEDGGLAMADLRGGPVIASAVWADVRAIPSTGIMRTKGRPFVYPTLELALGAAQTLVVGVWNSDLAWSDPKDRRRRKARWLVGDTDWHRLVRVLQSHDCMR